MDAATTAIHVSGLSVERGRRTVVSEVSFDIGRGEVVGLLGPSGSGKSTLIRALAGVQQRVTGTAVVLGHPAGHPDLRRRIGYLTQSPSVYLDLTVRENLAYFAAIMGAPRTAAAETAARVHLPDLLDARVDRLSGGQLARVSLAVALLGDPEVLLLDEPTVGLDPVLRRDLWNDFRRLAAEGATLLVSSHVMDEATRCDRLLLMREGSLLADMTPAALLAQTGQSDAESAFLALVEGAER